MQDFSFLILAFIGGVKKSSTTEGLSEWQGCNF